MGIRAEEPLREDGRETRIACWGLSKCDIDKTHDWRRPSPKVIFTRKLCCMDLSLCAERMLYRGKLSSLESELRRWNQKKVEAT